MPKVVEQEYDERLDVWKARVGGEVVTGRTPRLLRTAIARTLGPDKEFEIRVKVSAKKAREFASIVKEGNEIERIRREYTVRLDKLNVRRLAESEWLLKRRATMEMVAELLSMAPNRVQQLTDPRHYAGQRARAVRDRKIKPGSPRARGARAGADEG